MTLRTEAGLATFAVAATGAGRRCGFKWIAIGSRRGTLGMARTTVTTVALRTVADQPRLVTGPTTRATTTSSSGTDGKILGAGRWCGFLWI